MNIHHGDNLETLRRLAAAGERFDLVELDGPYGAGLEGWDILTEAEYVAHYAERLELVRQILQPWGVVFLFGYPEMVALVRAWAAQSGALHLRRWLTWYKQVTAHKGRKVETIAVFVQPIAGHLHAEFRGWLKARRESMGLKIVDACRLTGINAHLAHKVGGWLWFENDGCSIPTEQDYTVLKRVFDIPDRYDLLLSIRSFEDLTNIDYISAHFSETTRNLNDAGLRSKPVGLYETLFRPVVPPRSDKRALVLYGGSGNAAIAAGRLGYTVDICETDAGRCERIRRAYAWGVDKRDETPEEELGPLFNQVVDTRRSREAESARRAKASGAYGEWQMCCLDDFIRGVERG